MPVAAPLMALDVALRLPAMVAVVMLRVVPALVVPALVVVAVVVAVVVMVAVHHDNALLRRVIRPVAVADRCAISVPDAVTRRVAVTVDDRRR